LYTPTGCPRKGLQHSVVRPANIQPINGEILNPQLSFAGQKESQHTDTEPELHNNMKATTPDQDLMLADKMFQLALYTGPENF
jgi:hypothetical protein